MRLRAITFAFISVVTFASPVFAQQFHKGMPLAPEGPVVKSGPGCFDYYHFGSVQAKLDPVAPSTVSGTPLSFSGVIENNNSYPVVGGALYVKIFRKIGDEEKNSNGPDVVDQFFVKSDISIPAHGSVPVSFSWNVPAYAATGDYELGTFFTTDNKYNLSGLSFTDDVVGNTAEFHVTAERAATVTFEKDTVTVNNRPYHFAAYPPKTDPKAPVTIKAIIDNPTDRTTVPITWDLYYWDAQAKENLVKEEQTAVTIPAHGSATVTFTTADNAYPVYLLQGTLKWHDESSIINVRFVRPGVSRAHINFPSTSAFPLQAGQSTDLFSCFYNIGTDSTPGTFELSLQDRSGAVINSYTWTGNITPNMALALKSFTPSKNYDYFTLSAKLYQNGQLVDQSQSVYDCAAIDPSLCQPKEQQPVTGSGLTVGAILVILLLGLVRYGMKFAAPAVVPVAEPVSTKKV